ncbi:biotin transporter BioY [Clostridium estertheticum]|uniref:biotin transporter BioY n=1 Tax=Clostridium estertheticum TaxID=238834 RepID=UPI001C0B9BE0|nr:biotin transporter BioY [Clostridium estertheticum]MBU3199873.1 biotin transporter BioY [Clostridium estertheticum]WAG67027.1 biotin transporter BioY [Clostridium estertheticum]
MKLNLSIKEIMVAGLFAAITSVLAQISFVLPFSPIPITFQILAVFLSSIILGSKLSAISQLVYILLGAIGIPVFANFSGGLNCILGPTGGYLISYPIIAFIIGKTIEKEYNIIITISGLFTSLLICYSMGVLQLAFITKISLKKAILLGVAPYILLDSAKIWTAYLVGVKIRNSLLKARLIKC